MNLLAGPHLVLILATYGIALLAIGAIIYFAVLFALKSHTRWIDRGKPGGSDRR